MNRRRESGSSIRTILMGIIVFAIIGIVAYMILPFGSSSGGLLQGVLPQPTSTIKPGPTVMQALQREAKLETIQMTFSKDITIERQHGLLGVCSEKITYLGYFKVSAGVDLRKIQQGDISATNDGYPDQAQVRVKIPEAELMQAELDTVNSKIVAQETPKWVPGCSHEIADMTVEAQNKLREQVIQDALQQGILSQAKLQAAKELTTFLETAGYKDLVVQSQDGTELR